ncbi:TetR/AcrR family transcriptional regulator [Streptomyces sp. NPDC053069]|uniref:TetR/AcrR family transcriptional regulator n=1 Tax=Streptomyces sp. NPDC053069 TaxID=3365695 RepID=UPI0037D25344
MDAVHIGGGGHGGGREPTAQTGSLPPGDLRNALIEAAPELARQGGPEAVVLRAATRQAGVVPNAAYRHFADRDALLHAVSQTAMAQVARTMETTQPTGRSPGPGGRPHPAGGPGGAGLYY